MTEREIFFSDQEKLDIAEVAREVARQGEETLWLVTRAKIQLMGVVIRSAIAGAEINGVYFTPNQIRHEIDVMEEITKQAKIILQFEGRDSLSELDRRAQEAGWGSVYDPESRIYKAMNKDNRF